MDRAAYLFECPMIVVPSAFKIVFVWSGRRGYDCTPSMAVASRSSCTWGDTDVEEVAVPSKENDRAATTKRSPCCSSLPCTVASMLAALVHSPGRHCEHAWLTPPNESQPAGHASQLMKSGAPVPLARRRAEPRSQ